MSAPGPSLRIVAVSATDLFVGTPEAPEQVVRVAVEGPPGPVTVWLDGVTAPVAAELAGGAVAVDVPVAFGAPPGSAVPVVAVARHGAAGPQARLAADAVVAEPGWTVHMVSHFHYDPVWWNTQASYTQSWDTTDWSGSPREAFQHTGFDLVRAHLELTRHDPDYRFVLAETDYLKPYWDAHPGDRDYLRRLLAEGRCELMGGTYNEPNTNLTGPETTVRNLQYGIALQRTVLGGQPRTAWQLDAFGHDPQFPGLAAAAGLTGSSWARGPFHQWGPLQTTPSEPLRDARVMQFPSEFEWVAPSGRGLLTSYMPAHYSAGWWMDSSATLAEAEEAVYRIYSALKPVAATRNVLLPVGTDYAPPNKWVTAIHRDWAARYVWPRFVCAVPDDFFTAVRAELAASGRRTVPQTRDMNPIYTGKDVSYVDTKQAARAAEGFLADAERFATFAALLGARYPAALLDKAWRQLVYGAHHDAITGSEGDQVYLDLLTGWRDAYDIGRSVRDAAVSYLAARMAGPAAVRLVVANGLSWARTEVVRVRVAPPFAAVGLVLRSAGGAEVPFVAAGVVHGDAGAVAEATLVFLAVDVPATGVATYTLEPSDAPLPGWVEGAGATIANASYRVTVDPRRGGAVSSVVDLAAGREVLAAGRLGNELLLYAEYSQHPTYAEGPWHLLPTGPPRSTSAGGRARVQVLSSPLGQRLVVRGELDGIAYTQELTVWTGLSRVDCTTVLDGFDGSDQLVRLRWAADVPGGLPVSEVGAAVVGRGFGIVDTDTKHAPWTLDNPALNWFGLGSTARVSLGGVGPGGVGRALGVAEVVAGADLVASEGVRDLVVALVRAGVTSTTSVDLGSRYGHLAVDSNLPDFRLAVGGPDRNTFTAAVLETSPAHAAEVRRQVAATGVARVWVPAERPLAEVWVPNADLRPVRALPVLVLAGDLDRALASVVDDLADATVHIGQPADLSGGETGLADYTVALLNRGLPGFAVDTTGALHLSLLRSCTGWPSGVWIDPPRRTAPDGSNFQLQHWSHHFDYSLVAGPGDWRANDLVHSGHSVNTPLTAVVAPPPTDGTLPATGSLLASSADVVVTAVKPAGNPLAHGSAEPVIPAAGIAVRLYEPYGRTADARLTLPGATAAYATDLLEQPGEPLPVSPEGTVQVGLSGAEVATVVLVPGAAGLAGVEAAASGPAAGPGAEPARPGWAATAWAAPTGELLVPEAEPSGVPYARYWMHNSGPAPTGNLPVSVHADPPAVTSAGPVPIQVTVVSSYTDENWSGTVSLDLPPGWTADPPHWPVALLPGAHATLPVTVRPDPAALAGDHLVTVLLADGAILAHDTVTVTLPGAYPGAVSPSEVDLTVATPALSLRAGEATVLRADLTNTYRSPADVRVWLVGPVETWPLTPVRARTARIPADDTGELQFPVAVPADTRPGSWWLLLKWAYGPRIGYSESVRLTVEPRK
jgi:alpha-mannosidase